MMKEIIVKIEKTNTGYSAYYEFSESNLVTTTGKDLVELFNNLAKSTEVLESALNEK